MNILKEDHFNAVLQKQGYVTFDCLNMEEVSKLINLYNSNQDKITGNGFHASMYHKNVSYRKTIDEGIREVLSDSSHLIFDNYKMLYANFMVKEPGAESNMKLHQDWAYVDEQQANSYAIWIPLIDTNEHNGAFHVLPFSHNVEYYVRGPGVHCPFAKLETYIKENYMLPVYLKAGQGIIWNHRLVHSSPPNFGNVSRIAATAILVPGKEEVYHYYQENARSKVLQFRVDNEFFMNYKIGEKPKRSAHNFLEYRKVNITKKELARMDRGPIALKRNRFPFF